MTPFAGLIVGLVEVMFGDQGWVFGVGCGDISDGGILTCGLMSIRVMINLSHLNSVKIFFPGVVVFELASATIVFVTVVVIFDHIVRIHAWLVYVHVVSLPNLFFLRHVRTVVHFFLFDLGLVVRRVPHHLHLFDLTLLELVVYLLPLHYRVRLLPRFIHGFCTLLNQHVTPSALLALVRLALFLR